MCFLHSLSRPPELLEPFGQVVAIRATHDVRWVCQLATSDILQRLQHRAIVNRQQLTVNMQDTVRINAHEVGVVGAVVEHAHGNTIGHLGLSATVAIWDDVCCH